MIRSRLAADLWLLNGLDRRALWGNTCVATNLTIRRINRRDSAVVQVVGGAALGAAMQRNLAHYFTWLNSYEKRNPKQLQMTKTPARVQHSLARIPLPAFPCPHSLARIPLPLSY